jgi:hypothetical protein
MITGKYKIEDKILSDLGTNDVFLQELGILTYEDLKEAYEQLSPYDRVKMMGRGVAYLSELDPIISRITETGSRAIITEKYTSVKWRKGDLNTTSKGTKVEMQRLLFSVEDYETGIAISNKEALVDPYSLISDIIVAIVPSYIDLNRQLALEALMTLPSAESRQTPCLWRNTSGFSATADKIAPHNYGFNTFANTETHYIPGVLDENIVDDLVAKLDGKGYSGQIAIIANRASWKAYRDQFDRDDLEIQRLVRFSQDFKPNEDEITFVEMPDAIFPTGYYLAVDLSVKGLYKLEPEDARLKGFTPMFSNMDDLKYSRQEADFKAFGLGYGVQEKGFAAIRYTGHATTYASPTFLNFSA